MCLFHIHICYWKCMNKTLNILLFHNNNYFKCIILLDFSQMFKSVHNFTKTELLKKCLERLLVISATCQCAYSICIKLYFLCNILIFLSIFSSLLAVSPSVSFFLFSFYVWVLVSFKYSQCASFYIIFWFDNNAIAISIWMPHLL